MASTLLTKSAATPTNRKKYTVSFWCKKALFGINQYVLNTASDGSNRLGILFNTSEQLEIYGQTSGSENAYVRPTRLFRDSSAFYHIVVAVDTTQSTAADRVKIYVNGTLETVMTSTNYPSQNADLESHRNHYIGGYGVSSNYYFGGCLAHFHFVDGTAYPASTFGETDSVSGIWKPKTAPSVTYGNVGYFLKFENSGNLDLDSSGNNISFSTSGTLTQNVDTPSNNFATFNPLFDAYSSSISFNNGNLRLDHDASGWGTAVSSLAANTGKWYAEFKATSITSNGMLVGIVEDGYANNLHYVGVAGTIGYHYNGEIYNRDSNTSFGNSYAQGDIIGVAMDLTNGYVYFSKNGTFQNSGVPTSGATGTGGISIGGTTGSNYFFGLSINASGYHGEANFGQGYFGTTAVASAGTAPSEGGIFEYDCPSGYQALSTKGINSF